jgi:hypothetical protein
MDARAAGEQLFYFAAAFRADLYRFVGHLLKTSNLFPQALHL